MKTMNRIYVSPFKLNNGQWSSKRILFAAFRSRLAAELNEWSGLMMPAWESGYAMRRDCTKSEGERS